MCAHDGIRTQKHTREHHHIPLQTFLSDGLHTKFAVLCLNILACVHLQVSAHYCKQSIAQKCCTECSKEPTLIVSDLQFVAAFLKWLSNTKNMWPKIILGKNPQNKNEESLLALWYFVLATGSCYSWFSYHAFNQQVCMHAPITSLVWLSGW